MFVGDVLAALHAMLPGGALLIEIADGGVAIGVAPLLRVEVRDRRWVSFDRGDGVVHRRARWKAPGCARRPAGANELDAVETSVRVYVDPEPSPAVVFSYRCLGEETSLVVTPGALEGVAAALAFADVVEPAEATMGGVEIPLPVNAGERVELAVSVADNGTEIVRAPGVTSGGERCSITATAAGAWRLERSGASSALALGDEVALGGGVASVAIASASLAALTAGALGPCPGRTFVAWSSPCTCDRFAIRPITNEAHRSDRGSTSRGLPPPR